ncbi:MAG: ribonuclease HI family protein [bacterium]
MTQPYQLFCDGAARGNPGPASAGAVIKNASGEVVAEISEYLGETTNNQAEYQALRFGLQKALELKIHELDVFLDSELVVKQVKGLYKVKHPDLIPLHREIKSLLGKFSHVSVSHVYREKNKEADKLANLAIDRHFSK